jgi:Domain of unknown function (DUF929)
MSRRAPSSTSPTRQERRSQQRAARSNRRQRGEAVQRQGRIVWLAAGAVVLVLAGLVAAGLLRQAGSSAAQEGLVPPEVMADLTSVPPSTLEQADRSSVQTMPVPIRAAIQRGSTGLPLVAYIGAEYCPFCAAERWPLVVALSRFGTFSGLRLSHSAADDVYPNTATLSFYGSSYTSQYVELSAVELQSNARSGGKYRDLQTPTPAQENLLRTYDVPPYVPPSSAGAIPFLDIANQYMVTGSNFDAGLLRGLSQAQIAAMLKDGTTEPARAILGTANVLTAAVCSATADNPPDVCGQPVVRTQEAALTTLPAPARSP